MERPYSCSIFAYLHNITLWTAPRLEHFDISKEKIQLPSELCCLIYRRQVIIKSSSTIKEPVERGPADRVYSIQLPLGL